MTTAEARRRRKEIGGPKLSRDERKAERLTRRADMSDRREKMMAGDDAYLLPRDKGPVRRLVRDIVDSRRNVLGLFMPSALGLIFVMLALPPQLQQGVSFARPTGWWTRSSRITPKVVGNWAYTPPAAPHSCAGCARPGRRSIAAIRSPDHLCARWSSGVSGRASHSGRSGRSPNPPSPRSRFAIWRPVGRPTVTPNGRRGSPRIGRVAHRTGRRSKQ
jgi:hypothetical protein